MKILCHQDFKEPEYYFNNEPARVYICDLNHKAPSFIKKVKVDGFREGYSYIDLSLKAMNKADSSLVGEVPALDSGFYY